MYSDFELLLLSNYRLTVMLALLFNYSNIYFTETYVQKIDKDYVI